MGGGLMQLVAYGAQDVYLTGNPQITFWKVTYRRHTNFAMEAIEQTFNGQADFGRRVTCTISRNGDLAYRTYLQLTLPEISQENALFARWLDFPGHQLISQVEIEIGGLLILEEISLLKTVLVKADSVLLVKNLNNYSKNTIALEKS